MSVYFSSQLSYYFQSDNPCFANCYCYYFQIDSEKETQVWLYSYVKHVTMNGKLQCESMGAVEKKLKEMGIEYKRQKVVEGGIEVDQLFFHDPDGFMIEVCNCDNLPVVPLAAPMARTCSRLNLQHQHQHQQSAVPVVKF